MEVTKPLVQRVARRLGERAGRNVSEWHQHFIGFRARLNCENMLVIPAWLVRSNLNDPRKIPYLLVWKDARDREIMEAVRLARYVEPSNSRVTDNYVELERTDGSSTILRIVWRMLPRNGGRALLLMCSYCNTPRRYVYGANHPTTQGLFRVFAGTQSERLLHALNKDSGEMLLVAHGQECPKQDDHNRQRKSCWRH